MKLNSNITSMTASGILAKNESAFSKSTGRLSSGYAINKSGDDPVGFAISNRMGAKAAALKKAEQNTTGGVSMVQVADGAISEMTDMLSRMKELSVQSANGTNTSLDRQAIQAEVDQLSKEFNRIIDSTEYNGVKLLNGDIGVKGSVSGGEGLVIRSYKGKELEKSDLTINIGEDSAGGLVINSASKFPDSNPDNFTIDEASRKITYKDDDGNRLVLDYKENLDKNKDIKINIVTQGDMTIQVGGLEEQQIKFQIPELSLGNMGIDDINVTTEESAKEAMESLDIALNYVTRVRADLGAYENRFESTLTNLGISSENLQSSYSTIKDTDMAAEMVEYTKLQIVTQAGVSMLTQSNEMPQQALQLLQ